MVAAESCMWMSALPDLSLKSGPSRGRVPMKWVESPESRIRRRPPRNMRQRFQRTVAVDVALAGAESAAQTDLANAFVDRNQHDVHDSDAANAKVSAADK